MLSNSHHMYIGRFAPSPSGPLHMGSLLTALASFLDARANHGKWLLRIEDIDPPREQQGASTNIIQALQAHGLHWDEDIIWQHNNIARYQQALDSLNLQQKIFACQCTRQQLKTYNAYPGFCRSKTQLPSNISSDITLAVRINTQPAETINFTDELQGKQLINLQEHGGDFVLQRKDGLFAYHLAVTCDDAAQNITHIMRGVDLLETTPQHIFLQQQLKVNTPNYSHLPVLIDQTGNKLSKQFGATAIDNLQAINNLLRCLQYLQQPSPIEYHDCESILKWAIAHWDKGALKKQSIIKL